MARQVYSGRMTQATKEQFTEITDKALRRFLNDKINERLKQALEERRTTKTNPRRNKEENKIQNQFSPGFRRISG